jgi:hypothetical protein
MHRRWLAVSEIPNCHPAWNGLERFGALLKKVISEPGAVWNGLVRF